MEAHLAQTSNGKGHYQSVVGNSVDTPAITGGDYQVKAKTPTHWGGGNPRFMAYQLQHIPVEKPVEKTLKENAKWQRKSQ